MIEEKIDVIVSRIKELSQEKMILDEQSRVEENGGIKKRINIKRREIVDLLAANFWVLEIMQGIDNENRH